MKVSRKSSRSASSASDSCFEGRRQVHVVAGQVGQQRLDVVDGVLLVGAEVVRVARGGVVHPGAAQVLHADVLAGDGLDDVRAGDEHLRGAVDHHHEVGQRGGVDVAAGRRAHDQRDLRDDAGGLHVAVEDVAVQAEGDHALLDARAAALVDADQRAAGLEREVLHLDDLLAVHLAERAAEDGDVLAEHAHRAAVDGAVAGDHPVAVGPVVLQAEHGGAVPGELVELDEGALVQQHGDPLPGGLLAPGVLLGHRPLRAGVHRLVVAGLQLGQLAGGAVRIGSTRVGVAAGPAPRRLPRPPPVPPRPAAGQHS